MAGSAALVFTAVAALFSLPAGADPWEISYGEGFHSFVVSVGEADSPALEGELFSLDIPFKRLGTVNSSEALEVKTPAGSWSLPVRQLRAAWLKEGYWE